MQDSFDIKDIKEVMLRKYQTLPAEITAFKREVIMSQYTFNQRLVSLGFATLAITGLSYKAGLGCLRTGRNSVVSYVVLGQFAVPEIFNPYL